MRIVVTGAAGFVGSAVALRAKEQGHDVIALDNFERGLNASILYRHGIEVARWDCMEGLPPFALDHRNAATLEHGIDACVHLAAGTGSLSRPIDELRRVNVEMALKVYEDAQRFAASAVIMEYETSCTFLWPTTSLALGVPDSPYVISKEEGLAALKGRPGVVPLRFFNVTGAYKGLTERRRNEVHLMPMLVEAAQQMQPFTVLGTDYDTVDGSASRDFVNIVDVADAILALAADPATATPMPDGCTWLGTGETTTVRHAVKLVGQALDLPIDVMEAERRLFDIGEIRCEYRSASVDPVQSFRDLIKRSLTPPHVSIRDEALALSWIR